MTKNIQFGYQLDINWYPLSNNGDGAINMDELEIMYERSLLKTKVLNVTAQLKNDEVYTKEQAIEDLLEVVKMIEDKK